MNRQVISFSEVYGYLSNPSVRDNWYVRLALQMIALEAYAYASSYEQSYEERVLSQQIWNRILSGDYPLAFDTSKTSMSSRTMLVYTILNVMQDSRGPWSIHQGIYQKSWISVDILYLLSADGYTVVLDGGQEVVDNLREDPTYICTPSKITEYDMRYWISFEDRISVPSGERNILSYLELEGVINSLNQDDISERVSQLLQSRTDFVGIIREEEIWTDVNWRNYQNSRRIYNSILTRSILLTKIHTGYQIILNKYPPFGCNISASL